MPSSPRKLPRIARWARSLLAIFLLGSFAAGCSVEESAADVVIYGATPAGIMAATAASDRGRSVIVVEPSAHVGGMVGSGLSATDYWGGLYIAGPVREFFETLGRHYGLPGPAWTHEPKVAISLFRDQLSSRGIRLVTKAPLKDVAKEAGTIRSLRTARGTFQAAVFVDATYEGDLLAAAGGDFTVGRESREQYGEPEAGIRRAARRACPYCSEPIDAFGADGKPLPMVEQPDPSPDGTADDRVMNYNFRLCLTNRPANRVPIPEPEHYDPEYFEFFSRIAAALPRASVKEAVKTGRNYLPKREVRSAYFNMVGLPNGKYDLNSGSVFLLEFPGGSHDWPRAGPKERDELYALHKQYTLQYFKWMRTHPSVPSAIKSYIGSFGLCADEWPEHGHWPPLLYVREARRMLSDYVLTGRDILGRKEFPDAVLLGFSPLDSKSTRLVAVNNLAVHDGSIYKVTPAFQIPYRAITPKRGTLSNLLVPVAISASHVAYSAARMEPVLMGLGLAAGEAAALVVEQDQPVQDIPVAVLKRRIRATGQLIEQAQRSPSGGQGARMKGQRLAK